MTSTLLIYMCLGQKVWELILQAVRTDDLQTLDHVPGACAQSDEAMTPLRTAAALPMVGAEVFS